jgi:hypothetical protein
MRILSPFHPSEPRVCTVNTIALIPSSGGVDGSFGHKSRQPTIRTWRCARKTGFSPSSTHRTFWPGELAENPTLQAHQRMPYFAHRLQFHFYEQETLGATGHSRRFIDRLCARDQERNRETSSAETPSRIRGRSQGVFRRGEIRHATTRSRVLSSTERSLFPTDVLHWGSAKCVR